MSPSRCNAPRGSSVMDWMHLGEDLVTSAPERAAACFADAALADPLSHRPHLHQGLAALRASPTAADAVPHLQNAVRRALREANVTAATTTLRVLGETHAAAKQWESAIESVAEVVRLTPDDCVSSATLASLHSATNDYVAATAVLRAALAEDHACPLAHHGLAKLLAHSGDLSAALQHVRAALELRPFDAEYERTMQDIMKARAAMRELGDGAGSTVSVDPAGMASQSSGGERSDAPGNRAATHPRTTDRDRTACGASADWTPPRPPDHLAPVSGCAKAKRHVPGADASRRGLLLINPFEEGCFHDDMRANVRQEYHSCGQFNNVLASLLHALALSRILCRTLILPGFFVRFGTRLTRVSPFAERWLPTSHFLNLTLLRAAFDVREMHEWLPASEARKLTRLHARAVGGGPPQLRFFSYHNISFASVIPAIFPHFLQQQSELRWVSDDHARTGYFSHFEAGQGAAFWRDVYARSEASQAQVLAFDAAPSIGMGMDYLQWDDALRYTRGHVRYVGAVHAEAMRVRSALFGTEPFLAVHIRRGADRLHDFCHTGWGKRCFGWNITMAMCYPSTESVAQQIKAALERWAIPQGHIFLATDSPRPELFEDVLRAHGVEFARYGQQGPKAQLSDEYGLPVDQTLCAAAPYFLGNVPSTVTATIVQERDTIGWSRERTAFFGFEDEQTRQFMQGWASSNDFAAHYHGSTGCLMDAHL